MLPASAARLKAAHLSAGRRHLPVGRATGMDILDVERWDVMNELHRDLHDEYYYHQVSVAVLIVPPSCLAPFTFAS